MKKESFQKSVACVLCALLLAAPATVAGALDFIDPSLIDPLLSELPEGERYGDLLNGDLSEVLNSSQILRAVRDALASIGVDTDGVSDAVLAETLRQVIGDPNSPANYMEIVNLLTGNVSASVINEMAGILTPSLRSEDPVSPTQKNEDRPTAAPAPSSIAPSSAAPVPSSAAPLPTAAPPAETQTGLPDTEITEEPGTVPAEVAPAAETQVGELLTRKDITGEKPDKNGARSDITGVVLIAVGVGLFAVGAVAAAFILMKKSNKDG